RGGETLFPTLQSGTNSTTLALQDESDQDDYFIDWLIPLPAIGRVALVTDYDGETGVATVVDHATGAALDPAPSPGEPYDPPIPPARLAAGVLGEVAAAVW